MSDLINGLAALKQAKPGYLKAKEMYEGNAKEQFTSTTLQKTLGSASANFSFNYSRIVVTSRLSRMEVASVATQDGRADDVLANVWVDNALDQEIQDALEASLVYGDAYLIAWPSDDGQSADIFYNDPFNTRVFYQAENPRKKKYAIKQWMDGEKLRVNLYYADRIEKYISKGKPSQHMEDGDFQEYFDEGMESWPAPNEFDEVPVFHLRTGRMYGTPEAKSSFGPQNAINKLIATQMTSMDFTTAPQRYFLEEGGNTDGPDLGADFGEVDDDDFVDESGLKAGPGGVWRLKGVKQVGQFDVTPPSTFIEPFKAFIESMSTVTNTPMHAFNVGALPSGESLRAAEAPLNKRVLGLERLFGGVLREMHEFILEFLGYDNAKVMVTWAPVATYDDVDVWNTVDAKVKAGVPAKVALMEAGYTDTQIEEWYPSNERPRISIEDIDTLATAAQKLAAAVNLGLMSPTEARRFLPQDYLDAAPVADLDTAVDAITAENARAQDDREKALQVLLNAGVEESEARSRVGLD